jgi:hypothetical protein
MDRPLRPVSGQRSLGLSHRRNGGLERRFPGFDWVYVGTFPTDSLTTSDSPPFENGAVREPAPAVPPRFRFAPDRRLDIEGAWDATDGVPSWHMPTLWIPDFRKNIVICDDLFNIKVVQVMGVDDTDPGAVIPYTAGIVGPTGVTGSDGESAYQIAVDNGFVGTEAEWLASLMSFVDFSSETPSGAVDSSNTVFTLATAPAGGVLVFLDGVLQVEGTDYTISGGTITFATAPATGSVVTAVVSVIATGPAGPDGASAYDVAVANGFVGTEVEWLATLIGPSGATGELPRTLNVVIDGGGVDITTGIKCDVYVPVDCTIGQWTLLADAAGSIEIDVWAADLSTFPPTVADSIAGSSLPTLSSADNDFAVPDGTWSPDLVNGEVLRFNVNSCSGITRVTLALTVQRT